MQPSDYVQTVRAGLAPAAGWSGDITLDGWSVFAVAPQRTTGPAGVMVLVFLVAWPGGGADGLDRFRAACQQYAREHQVRLKLAPRVSVGAGTAVMPVAVCRQGDDQVRAWARSKRGQGRGRIIYPVAVDLSTATITHRKRLVWGAACRPAFRAVIDDHLRPPLLATPT